MGGRVREEEGETGRERDTHTHSQRQRRRDEKREEGGREGKVRERMNE